MMVGASDPAATDLHVGALDRRPGGAMRPFLLARIIWMRRKGVIERFAVDVLGVRGRCDRAGAGNSLLERYGMTAYLD